MNLVNPGQQMVLNGDFSQGTNYWSWADTGGASARWEVANNVSYVDISNGGAALESLELWQAGMPLTQGKKYVFGFDAWSEQPRSIQVQVGQVVAPSTSYSGPLVAALTPNPSHFRYVFTMQHSSDSNSDVIFDLGASSLGIYIDNVSLFSSPPGDFNLDGRVDARDLAVMAGEWLKQQPNLVSDLDQNGRVNFKDFTLLGQSWSPTSQ